MVGYSRSRNSSSTLRSFDPARRSSTRRPVSQTSRTLHNSSDSGPPRSRSVRAVGLVRKLNSSAGSSAPPPDGRQYFQHLMGRTRPQIEVRILRWPRARNGGPTSDTCIAMVRPTGVTRHEYPRRSLHRIGATTASGSTEVSMSESSGEVIDIERAVKARYSRAAKAPEASLCCPTSYDPTLLVSSCSGALR